MKIQKAKAPVYFLAALFMLAGNIIGVRLFVDVNGPIITEIMTPDEIADTTSEAENEEPREPTQVSNAQPAQENTPEPITQDKPQTTSKYVQEKVVEDTIITEDNEEFPLREYTTQVVPNDPAINQWWVASATLPQLWDVNTGSANTLLAIVDTGFALDHEEFQNRWYENDGESGATLLENPSRLNCTDQSRILAADCNLIDDDYDGIVDNEAGLVGHENESQLNCTDQSIPLDKSCNLVDDDGNGLIDDWRGWDFVSFDNSPQAGEIDPTASGSGTKHGSYVTAVAAANANNDVGIAGVNWQTEILPLQALPDNGSGTSIGVARSIRYAVDQGADVISLSLGGSLPDSFTRRAVQEAIAAGVIVVAAAGNDGCDCISYPANYPEVVAVGALTSTGARAGFSSYGENLDVMAPGVGLYTASWTQGNPTSAYANGISGTSLATPIVSGLLTSLVGQYPELSPHQIISLMTEQTNRLTIPANDAWSPTLGFGTIDSYAAHTRAVTPYSPSQLVSFDRVSRGDRLYPGYNFEPSFTSYLYQCESGDYGTTKLYRLKSSNDEFYTVSHVEQYEATRIGYTSTVFANVCVGLPIDVPESVRAIDVIREFSNNSQKP